MVHTLWIWTALNGLALTKGYNWMSWKPIRKPRGQIDLPFHRTVRVPPGPGQILVYAHHAAYSIPALTVGCFSWFVCVLLFIFFIFYFLQFHFRNFLSTVFCFCFWLFISRCLCCAFILSVRAFSVPPPTLYWWKNVVFCLFFYFGVQLWKCI